MTKDIFLVGHGLTRFGELWEKNLSDLMDEATQNALNHSGISARDIDLIVVSNMLAEITNGQAHMGALAAELLPHRPPALRVESACGSGAFALHTACAFLESGRAKTVLVLGAEKMTDASIDKVTEALMGAAHAEKDQPSGLTFPGIFGLIAQRYMYDYGLTREDLSLVSAVHHRQGAENPYAQFRMTVTPEDVSRSAPVADPLRLLDCSPVSDGAAACILSTTHRSDLRVAASQIATECISITDRESLTSFAATREAVEHAFAEAEIERTDIHTLETHDCFSIAAVINLEDLGFAKPGEGIEVYRNLWNSTPASPEGSPSVNFSGGLKACGHPVAATGVKQLIDAGKTLAKTHGGCALTHNFGGACATCAVHILENLSAHA